MPCWSLLETLFILNYYVTNQITIAIIKFKSRNNQTYHNGGIFIIKAKSFNLIYKDFNYQ